MIGRNNFLEGVKCPGKFVLCFRHRLGLCDFRPKRNHQLIGFTSEDEQVHVSQEVGEIFMYFIISKLFGVVAAAIQGSVDCEDYISHWIALTPSCELAL